MLEVFPASSLDSSIVTPVLIGVVLVWLLQETLGWGLSGLVIPGYMASIMVIQPETGAVIAVEGVLTYAIVRALSEHVPRWWPWTPFFGRDRFFHILLISVAVRLAMEAPGGLLDLAGEVMAIPRFGDLNAMGLILVPLVANALWRSGVVMGIPRLGLPLVLTWALLELVLLPYTNLSLTSFELTYEDLALDFEGSAKAHLLLLVGAGVAALVNLHWGWDMGGIIVPGLLTLIWLEPSKLGVTLTEAMLVAVGLRLVVLLPGMRRLNLTGGRTLVLGFVLDYILRTAVALFPWQLTGLSLAAVDLQGFGYLLPTLIAVRMVHHREVLRVLMPVLATSFTGFVLGSGLGYLAAVISPVEVAEEPPTARVRSFSHPLLGLVDQALEGGTRDPATAGGLARQGAQGVQAFRGGAGALYLRQDAATEAVVVAWLGSPGMSQAAWTLAELGDARGVLLCPAGSESCKLAAQSLDARGYGLWVLAAAPGPGTLRFERRLAESLKLASVVERFGSVDVGPARKVSSGAWAPLEPELVLSLGEAGRMRASARVFQGVAATWDEARDRPWEESVADQARASRLEHVLHELVLDPWMVWFEQGSEEALAAAVGGAGALELLLARDGDHSLLVGAWWRARLDRQGAPVVVEVPQRGRELGATELGDALARSLGAAAFVEDLPSVHPVPLQERERPAHLVVERVLESLGNRDQVVLGVMTVRGVRDRPAPEAEVVLSLGRSLRTDEAVPPVATAARKVLEGAGLAPRFFDGGADVMESIDASNRVRSLARVAVGREAQVTVFASTWARDSLSPVEREGHPLDFMVGDVGLDREDLSLAELSERVAEGPARPPRGVAEVMADLVTLGRPIDLSRLAVQARRGGQRLSLVCVDEGIGCRWLQVSRCSSRSCTGTLLPLHRDPRPGRQATDPTAALLLDGADLPLSWERQP